MMILKMRPSEGQRYLKRLLAGAAALALVGASTSACVMTPEEVSVAECYATTNGPSGHDDGTGIESKKILSTIAFNVIGTVWTHCVPSPIEHYLTVELWYEPLGSVENWHVVEKREISRIPNALPYPNVVTTTCLPGNFKLEWFVVGRNSEGQLFTTPHIKGYPKPFSAGECGLVPH